MKYQLQPTVRWQWTVWQIMVLALLLMTLGGLAMAQQANQQTDRERKEAERRAKQQANEEERKLKEQEKRAGDLNRDFLDASRKCQLERVRDLLRRGANINARDKQGRSALFLAYPGGGNFDEYPSCELVLRELLNAGAPVDDAQGDLASFALVWALENNRSEHVAHMLSKGVTANSRAGLKALKRALEAGNEPLISLLQSHQLLMPHDAVALAAGSGNEKLVNNLLDRGMLIPYHAVALAAASGNAKLVNDLLDRGADIFGSEREFRASMTTSGGSIQFKSMGSWPGKDALMYAIAKGHVEIVRILLARGAGRGANVLRVYEGGGMLRASVDATALDLAAAFGQAEIVELLLEKGIIPEKLTTPLVAAALGGHADVVRVLLGRVSDEEKTLALAALSAYLEKNFGGFESYRKESRLLLLAQLAQTAEGHLFLLLQMVGPPLTKTRFPKLSRDDLLKKAEAEGFLATLQLLEESRTRNKEKSPPSPPVQPSKGGTGAASGITTEA